MSSSRFKNIGVVLLAFTMLLVFACHKKTAPPPPAAVVTPPPTPPPPPAPAITLRAQPTTINRGQSTTLTWEARNATTVTIEPGLGTVQVTGNRSVSPTSSVTYSAKAVGPGGEATSDTVRITVNIPPPPPTPAPPPPRPPDVSIDELFRQNVKEIYFDFDKADIRPDQVSVLQSDAAWLKSNPGSNVRFTIEGHCDERGSAEYNLGLGDRRANATKESLISQGVAANRINTVSYGKERPVCRDPDESCYMRNRRAAFTRNP